MSKLKYNKFFVSIVLLIVFIFLINSNVSYARKISFSLHDGLISTLLDDEDTDNEDPIPDDDNKDDTDTEPEPGPGTDEPDQDKPDQDEEVPETGEIKDGVYSIVCAGNENYVLDIESLSIENQGNLHIWQKTGALNQRFYISYEGDGYYKIANINSAKFVDVDGGSTESGANIQQYEDNGSDAQKFKIQKNSDGTYTFIAKCSGMAIDVEGGTYSNGVNVRQYEVNNSTAQKFKLVSTDLVAEGIVSIKSAINPSMRLDIKDKSTQEGTKVQLAATETSMGQKFEIHKVGTNEIRIRTAASGGWLKETSKEEGANVVQSGNGNTSAKSSDTWQLEWDDGIILINKESGLALNINGSTSTNGAAITVANKADTDTQRFIMNKEDLIYNGWYGLQSKYGTMLDMKDFYQGTDLRTMTKADTYAQVFEFELMDNGYKIKSPLSGFVIDVEGGSMLNAATVQMERDAGTTSERWTPVLMDGGYIGLKNVNSGMMLNVHMANKNPGAIVNQGKQDNGEPQQWKLVPTTREQITSSGNFLPNGLYTIQSKYGTMLDVKSTAQGTPLQTYSATGTSRQVFEFELMSDGYKIKSPITGYVLDVYAGSTDNAAQVQMEIDAGTRSQRWTLVDFADGYIGFKNVNSGLMLNVHMGNTQPGAVINQGKPDNSDAQKWHITATTYDEFSNAWGDSYYTDKAYLSEVVDRATRVGSSTDWFIAIDVRKFRLTLLQRVNGKWYVDACFNATMGYLGSNGLSHTGLGDQNGKTETNWTVTRKIPNRSGDIWFVSYIDYTRPDGSDYSQGIHNHYELAGQSYSSHGCPRLTDAHAKYVYDTVPIGTRVHIWQ